MFLDYPILWNNANYFLMGTESLILITLLLAALAFVMLILACIKVKH